ncbi:hypothetical protein B0H11DRAFT_1930066 [Mycena galericulata]|nr:hypothetical protein B0H11DRAFT_1930066 [Mycena galericulata]
MAPEVWEAHEQRMAQRVAEIEAHRERHRKRRKSSGWPPEECATALAAYRRDRGRRHRRRIPQNRGRRHGPHCRRRAGRCNGNFDNPEDSRREEEVDAALAILALAGDKMSSGMNPDSPPSSLQG